jgi:hypothetical protein
VYIIFFLQLTVYNNKNNIYSDITRTHNQKINTRMITQFHIALLKHATTLWKLRCIECNATDTQRKALMQITNVATLRAYMAEYANSVTQNYKGSRQTIIRKWLDCSRTPISVPRSRKRGYVTFSYRPLTAVNGREFSVFR